MRCCRQLEAADFTAFERETGALQVAAPSDFVLLQRHPDGGTQTVEEGMATTKALSLVEPPANFVGQRGRGADVQRALLAGLAKAQRKVRAAANAVGGAPRGDHGALAPERGALGQELVDGGEFLVNKRASFHNRRRLRIEREGSEVGFLLVIEHATTGNAEVFEPREQFAGFELGADEPEVPGDDINAALGEHCQRIEAVVERRAGSTLR